MIANTFLAISSREKMNLIAFFATAPYTDYVTNAAAVFNT